MSQLEEEEMLTGNESFSQTLFTLKSAIVEFQSHLVETTFFFFQKKRIF